MADFSNAEAGSGVQDCPLAKTYLLAVTVVDPSGAPVSGAALQLRNGDGLVIGARTDSTGGALFQGLASGTYSVSLIELDRNAWRLDDTSTLSDPQRTGDSPAPFAASMIATPDANAGEMHAVVAGEGVTKIAAVAGVLPDAIWSHPKNATLKGSRKSMDVLTPGEDVVFVPARQINWIDAAAGSTIRLVGTFAPAFLKVRFLDTLGAPRANEEYLLTIETESGAPIEDRVGATDGDGYIDEPVPPDAAKAEVFLGTRFNQEKYTFAIGHVDPLTTDAGLRARLESLGFVVDSEASTAAALEAYQGQHGLDVTGVADDATLAHIEQLYLV